MIQYIDEKVIWQDGMPVKAVPTDRDTIDRSGTMTYQILRSHNVCDDSSLFKIKFDALVSHDITYVGVIQNARASGMHRFPVPYVMTNCHNSLCAVGGTINDDDHAFGLSAAQKYGGIYVPPNLSIIHSYAYEEMAGCGKMILGSDSHTRYGAVGTLGIGEGAPELVKQLLHSTWDIKAPEVVLVYLTGKPRRGVGPHDVALALIGATFKSGAVKNRILEFAGPGVESLPIDFRMGLDIMPTESSALSSIWITDDEVKRFYEIHGRPEDFRRIEPENGAQYDAIITIDLDEMESMIALPFHPSNVYTIRYFLDHADELLREIDDEAQKAFPKANLNLSIKIDKSGRVFADQGIIAGCAGGTFDNIVEAADIVSTGNIGNGFFSFNVYPMSMPVALELMKNGAGEKLVEAGTILKPCFCGPCFAAGDIPANNSFSLRNTTRNFPNREGSKPGEGQIAAVALMDARSIAATAANGGSITPASEYEYTSEPRGFRYDRSIYERRCYFGYDKADPEKELVFGPNITDWPEMYPLSENMLIELAAVIHDPVTTTDELIPSGETSSLRSNPLKLSEYALSRRVPEYVSRAKAIAEVERKRRNQELPAELVQILSRVGDPMELIGNTGFGSGVFANRPGDGSAREQAASCQKVLGGVANICYDYATRRYQSNCINWGILPFTIGKETPFEYEPGDCIFVPGVLAAIQEGKETLPATVVRHSGATEEIVLYLNGLTEVEREILVKGCLINYYSSKRFD